MPKIKKVFTRKNWVEKTIYPKSYQITFVYYFYDWSIQSESATVISTQTVPKWDTPVPTYPTTDYNFEWFDKIISPVTGPDTYTWIYRKKPGWVYYNASLQLFSVSRDGTNRKTFQDRDYGASTAKWVWTQQSISSRYAMTLPSWFYIPDAWYWGKQQNSSSQAIQRSMEIIDCDYNAINLFGFLGDTSYVTYTNGSSLLSKKMCSSSWKIYDYMTMTWETQAYCRLAMTTPIVPDSSWTKIY